MDYSIGDNVSLAVPLPYLKTAESMPMLRPPDLVSTEEVGKIVALNPKDVVSVKFRRGTFLIPRQHLRKCL